MRVAIVKQHTRGLWVEQGTGQAGRQGISLLWQLTACCESWLRTTLLRLSEGGGVSRVEPRLIKLGHTQMWKLACQGWSLV